MTLVFSFILNILQLQKLDGMQAMATERKCAVQLSDGSFRWVNMEAKDQIMTDDEILATWVFIFTILVIGEPDLLDGLIHWLLSK